MELLNRYRNVTVLLLVIFAQLILLAYQVKSNQDVRLIRVWAVTAVTPLARAIESGRSGAADFLKNYIVLHNLRDENRNLRNDLGRLKLQNQYLRSELETADRVTALSAFQARNPSRTIPTRVIGTGTGGSSRVVFIDRGSRGGVMRGMAVITPDGVVGKVIAAYPTASQVLLITDQTFAAGVISQKHRVRGTVRGLGYSKCQVDNVQNEEQVDSGEWFFTSGDDGVFPKGIPVGAVAAVSAGPSFKQVYLAPSGLQGGLEEVLVLLEGVHQPIPELTAVSGPVHLQPSAPAEPEAAPIPGVRTGPGTEADRLIDRYRAIGEAQGHKFGEGVPGSKPPDFNLKPEAAKPNAAAPAPPGVAQPVAPGAAKPAGPEKPAGATKP